MVLLKLFEFFQGREILPINGIGIAKDSITKQHSELTDI